MTCNQDSILSLYHDGELPSAEALRLEAHVARCVPCRLELARLERISQTFALSPVIRLSQIARRRIEDAMNIPAWVRLILPVARPFAAAAVLLMAVGLPLLAMNNSVPRSEPSTAAGLPVAWETEMISRDTPSDPAAAAQVQFADWVVADLSPSHRR